MRGPEDVSVGELDGEVFGEDVADKDEAEDDEEYEVDSTESDTG